MKKKQYKVKIENGQVIPLEPFDLTSPKEGVIIFFELEEKEELSPPPKEKKKLNLDWIGGLKEYRDKYTALELQKKLGNG